MSHVLEFEELAVLCGELIGIPTPSPDDNFIDLGGDSLTALQLAILVEEKWGLELDVSAIVFAESLGEIHASLLEPVPAEAGAAHSGDE